MWGPECGLQVVDLSYLPDSVHHVTTYRTPLDSNAHNLSIDTANARAYVLKTDYTGFRIIDISNPDSLIETGYVNTTNIHDVYARNDTVWVAEGYNHGYSVWDCSDPSNAVLLGRYDDINLGYCHNIWASPDGKYFATTEETADKTVKIWDASDMSNITFAGEYLAPCNLAHNVHWWNNFLIISHYQSGVAVVSVADPSNPVQVGVYDNYPWGETPNFRGCWGAFPFTQNGYIYGSTIEGRLTLLGFDPLALEQEAAEKRRLLSAPFPNPSSEQVEFTLRLKQNETVTVSILDNTGKTIMVLADGEWVKGESTFRFSPGKELAKGLYFIHAVTPEGMDSRTFVVE
jgi:choice-of-anchor B domain-containing protein